MTGISSGPNARIEYGLPLPLGYLQAVTHPSSNRAQCRLITLIELNALTTTLCRHLLTEITNKLKTKGHTGLLIYRVAQKSKPLVNCDNKLVNFVARYAVWSHGVSTRLQRISVLL